MAFTEQESKFLLQEQHNQISFEMMPSISSSSSATIHDNFISRDGEAYDHLGDLDQALFLYLDGQEPLTLQDQKNNSGMKPPTLNIFPSQPMHVEPSSTNPNAPKRPSDVALAPHPSKLIKCEQNPKGRTSSSEQEGPKTPDPKTLRRLAQNREAARKSRLRKKAYVQQLESSRIKLAQMEQELQRARAQGFYFGVTGLGGDQDLPLAMSHISTDSALFDMEYSRWIEDHNRLMFELRNAVQENLPENELRLFVGNCLAHYDEVMKLKSLMAKTDVFHLISGTWKTPVERCFMWIGGFRPSQIIKILIPNQIEPLTEEQAMCIYGLQQSTHDAEEALSKRLEALTQSLSEAMASESLSCSSNMADYMAQMAIAMNKLTALEGFVQQADNLRHQTLHRLHQVLTVRQTAVCLLTIAEYFHRLRALSSLWLSRPRQD